MTGNGELTCHPMPLLRTCGGGGVALDNRAAALKAPVDCNAQNSNTELLEWKLFDLLLAHLRNHIINGGK
jgi:hypothetical protein